MFNKESKIMTFTFPTEIVYKATDKAEIVKMLNARHSDGWILDKLIDHAIHTENAHGQYVIYYFRKEI